MTCAVVLWVLLGTPAGYVAARFYKCKYKSSFNVTALKFISLNYHHSSDFPSDPVCPLGKMEKCFKTEERLHAGLDCSQASKLSSWIFFYCINSNVNCSYLDLLAGEEVADILLWKSDCQWLLKLHFV